MRFRFDADQEFQVDAIEAVADLFEGQPRSEFELLFSGGSGGATAVANRLDLDEATLLANLNAIQERNELEPDSELRFISAQIETADGEREGKFLNFSVEMETGTGKTYVYLRTIQELFKRYGTRKFIVVVPSVAVREGVLKSLAITADHFAGLYGNPPYRFYGYRADNLALIRQFALSDGIEVMVITIDAFNRPTNVLRQPHQDRLQGETPLHLVQAARPVLILDEPQNMETELRQAALAILNPIAALRYSATHRDPYNTVYRLTPFQAYRRGLVKRIEVAGVEKEDDLGQPLVRVESIKAQKRSVTTRLTVQVLMKTGAVKEKTLTLKPGDSLVEKTGRNEYEEYDVEEINPGGDFVRFANHRELHVGQAQGTDKDAIFDAQIRYTIEEHFRKQKRLRARGIKVLSLFFIDRVANYVEDEGLIRGLFTKHFNELKADHPEWADVEAADVHAGYFASKRRRSGEEEFVNSRGNAEDDRAVYDLIMKDKERLLSWDEPVAFVFSHSALREGWDNPNVFQICTLNETGSEVKKRQEVGRGLRLPVDQTGQRITDAFGDALTVVANESYDRFVTGLQSEIESDFGTVGTPPKPGNARKRGSAKLEKSRVLAPEFQELWKRISQKTRYSVKIDTDRLLKEVVPQLDDLTVRPPRITITKAQVSVGTDDVLDALQLSAAKTVQGLEGRYALPNLVDVMGHLMEHTTPSMYLTRATLLEMFRRLRSKEAAIKNPHDFATAAVQIIKQHLADQLVEGIRYAKVDDWYEMTQWEMEVESWEQYLIPTKRSIYDHIVFDSEVEKRFVEGLEKREDILVYVKLPAWFKVPTPVGEYNPDWAVVREERDEHGDPTGPKLFLVRETKSTHRLDKLRPDERRKILSGKQHFKGALKVDYAVVTSPSEV